MKLYCFFILLLLPAICGAQTAKMDTIKGVVVYVGHSNLRYIAKGNYHTYTLEATQIRTDTGIVSIQTEFGYIDLKKNYQFYPVNKLQAARLKSKP